MVERGGAQMKKNRLLAAVMAGALVVTAVGVNQITDVQAAVTVPDPVKTFTFENDLDGSTAKTAARGDYTGAVDYTEGHTGQGVALGNYGLELEQENLGENHTVSLWVKKTGTPVQNSSLIYMGAAVGATENWVSVAGSDSQNIHVWTNGDGFGWTTGISGVALPADEWTLVTVAQEGRNLDLYVNGELAGEMQAARSLVGDENDICIGVTNWSADSVFPAVVDDIQIYDEALTADQVYMLYNPDATAEEILQDKGFTVTDSVTIFDGETEQIDVDLPAGVTADDVEITYSSDETDIAEVSADGTVTAVAEGTAEITTTVTAGSYEGTRTTTVNVSARLNEENVVVSYDMSSLTAEGEIADLSGLGNNAAISGAAELIQDDGRDVLELTDSEYVELPMGIYNSLTDKEAFTIEVTYARSATSGTNAWLYCFGSNVQSTGTNYLFFCPNFGSTIRSGIKDASNERLFTTTVSQSADEYYTVDMVFDHGVITMYQDGVEVGTALNTGYSMESIVNAGTRNGILGFIGRSCWSADGYFNGKVDSFKIYNKAMSAEDVQLSNPDYLEGLQADLNAAVTEEIILGEKNDSLDEVRYDLNLPSSMGDLTINWTSDPEGVIAEDGRVYNSSEDQSVTLTASVTSGVLTAEKTFTITVKALDLSRLEELLEQAGNIDASLFTEDSVTAFRNAIDGIDITGVQTQSQADDLIAEINQAVSLLQYKDNYDDPWDIVNGAAPAEDISCDVGYTETLFTVPEEIADAVIVTYSSDNEEVAVYEADENGNGVMTALAAGTAIVTVRVEAKSDGYALEYATVVTVGEKPEQPGGEDPSEPGGEDPSDPSQPGGEGPSDPGQPGGDDQNAGGDGQNTDGNVQNSGSGNNNGADARSPKTGDSTNVLPWAGAAAAALAAAGYTVVKRKKVQ